MNPFPDDASRETAPVRRARRLQSMGMLVALIAAGAYVAVPIPVSPVPIVLQNAMVVLAGLVLPVKAAVATVVVYLVIGAAGLPVFAGGTAGLAQFAGPTGGYLMSYPVSALIAAAGVHGFRDDTRSIAPDRSVAVRVLTVCAAFLVVYLGGVPWLAVTVGFSASEALAAGAAPFLIGDAVKAAALILLVQFVPARIWRSLR